MASLQIGFVNYLNCLPIYQYFATEKKADYTLINETPATMNHLMQQGELLASNVSSIEYARHQDLYRIIPGICIASTGPAQSVKLYSRQPIEDLNGATIALTRASATSQILTRILLQKKYLFTNTYLEMEPDLDAMLKHAPAALLIGDDALAANSRTDLHSYDLGKIWYEFTRLPFVFSLWVLNRQRSQQLPRQTQALLADFQAAGERSPNYIRQLQHHNDLGLSASAIADYFTCIDFNLTEDARQGLLRFYEYAAELGLAPTCRDLGL